jgi:hypothetical protein
LYKELEQVSILLDKAKETFMGKQIFKWWERTQYIIILIMR